MEIVRNFAERVLEESGKYPVIVFGSALHGSGRSFLADITYKKFVATGIPAIRISTGEIFREIAENKGITINELMELQSAEPEKFYRINIEVDSRTRTRMEEESEERAVIVDSNLAAYYAEIENAYALLVYTDPTIVGERVFQARRDAEEPFPSPEAALKAMIERTENDIKLYRELSTIARDNFWKMVYRIGARDLEQNLQTILQKEIPRSPFFHETINNSGTPEESWEQIERWIIKAV